jgi:hypothetical protein
MQQSFLLVFEVTNIHVFIIFIHDLVILSIISQFMKYLMYFY